jgi:hypothetical protein
MLEKPIAFPSFGAFSNLFQKTDGLSFIARFTRVVDGDNHLDVDSNDKTTPCDEPSPSKSLAWNSHAPIFVEKVNRDDRPSRTRSQMR